MALAARALALAVGIGIACACGSSEQDTCASGLTKVCLSDGTTCTCAPSCASFNQCAARKICRKGSCTPCTGQTCVCTSSLCIPASWSSGDAVTFE
ncbi:MAG TPA: hypothetical protein VF765_09975 [Polyangiaceae bacterium]